MPAIRGMATNPDPGVRQAAYDAEMVAWPQIATSVAAALNAIKGEANTANHRRRWDSPLDASLYSNNVSRPTFDAMNEAITGVLPDLRRWMRTKARIHGHEGGLPGSDLIAPLPNTASSISWAEGLDWVDDARYLSDSIHPNDEGMQRIGRGVASAWKNTPYFPRNSL